MTCAGCGGATATARELAVSGAAAAHLGVPDGTVVDTRVVCDACQAMLDADLRRLRAEARRLKMRLRTRKYYQAIMGRRVDRYYRNGTFKPLAIGPSRRKACS